MNLHQKTVSLILSVVILLTAALSGCGSTESVMPMSRYISGDTIPLTAFALEETPTDIAVVRNVVFAAVSEGVKRIDILTGKSDVILPDVFPDFISCDNSQLAVLDDGELSVYDFDGNLKSSYTLPDQATEPTEVYIGIGGAAVPVETGMFMEDIWYVDLERGDWQKLDSNWRGGASQGVTDSISIPESGILNIIYDYNISIAGSDCRSIRYDLKQGTTVSGIRLSAAGYYVEGQGVYGFTHFSGPMWITKTDENERTETVLYFNDDELRKMNVFNFTTEVMEDPVSGESNIYDLRHSTDILYSDGVSFVMLDRVTDTLISMSVPQGESVKVYGDMTVEFMDIMAKFVKETGIQINAISYPRDMGWMQYVYFNDYNDILRDFLFDGSGDFDLFFCPGSMIGEVLSSGCYEPLDDYENVVSNFDANLNSGLRGMMSYGDQLFGIPVGVAYSHNVLRKAVEEVDLPDNPTMQDIFDLCDSLQGTDTAAFMDAWQMNTFISDYVDDMLIQDGKADAEELEWLLAGLYERYRNGTLSANGFFGEADEHIDNRASKWVFDTEYVQLDQSHFDWKANSASNAVGKLINPPMRSGYKYFEATSLIMYPGSKNKENASKLMAFMISESEVYNEANPYSAIGKDITRYSPAKSDQYSDSVREQLEFMPEFYENSRPLTTSMRNDNFVMEVLMPLYSGEITAKEAAARLVSRTE